MTVPAAAATTGLPRSSLPLVPGMLKSISWLWCAVLPPELPVHEVPHTKGSSRYDAAASAAGASTTEVAIMVRPSSGPRSLGERMGELGRILRPDPAQSSRGIQFGRSAC